MQTLYSKLAITLVILLFLVGLSYAALSRVLLEKTQQSGHQQVNRELAADLAREMKLIYNGSIDRDTMHDIFHMSMLLNPGIEVYYLDLQGRIVDSASEPEKIKRDSIDLNPIQEFLAGNSMYPVLGDDPRNPSQKKSFSVALLPDSQNPQGYLYVVLQSSKLDQAYAQEDASGLSALGLWALLGSLAVGLPTGLVLFHYLTRRIRRLDKAVRDFRHAGFKSDAKDLELLPVSEKSGDEISQLTRHFNSMARHIRSQYTTMELQDKQRRNMVANVSHDLRTPLASLHGYIERLHNRYESLPDIERKAHLAIALRNSHRLSRLIDDLFELSKLEAREIQPEFEPFSLSELAQDIVVKFRLQAESRHVSLELDTINPMPLVMGDIALLDRALSNLIDNAIEHSVSGDHVYLSLNADEYAIEVQVQDNGQGIAEEQMDAIFDRFYRGDDTSAASGKHAGLGLAITQRILELHNQTIRVKSRLGEGTQFSFSIPVWQAQEVIAS